MEEFAEFIRPRQARFTLFGSGDFHHLSALWLRGVAEPFTLVSFDNHPDWDIRPPHWCCGTWVNRALALPNLQRVAIWGCGNFELNWPGYLWISRTALKAQRLAVWPWAERLKPSGRKRWGGIVRETWREDFSQFSRGLAGQAIYVTVDMDCLDERVAATNWEQGLFTAEDVAWALGEIRKHARIVGGDLCGAFSPQAYARPIQRFLATRDHPPLAERSPAETRERNAGVFADIWPVLTAG
jgi:arginase family enzyme